MRITIENFRGIRNAELDFNGVTLIAGTNAAGKTSIAQAIASVLTGNPIPMAGIRKNAAGLLVHVGSAQGRVALEGEKGSAVLAWPSAKLQTDGIPPQASAISSGLESLTDGSRVADRARMLAPYLDADPTPEDLSEALPSVQPEYLQQLWESIQVNGWDLAHDQAKTKGAEFKGRWHQVTGQAYGSKKAANWYPIDWDESLTGLSIQSLTGLVNQAHRDLDQAISRKAVDESERELLEKAAAITVDLDHLEEELKETRRTHNKAIQHRNNLPPAGENDSPIASQCPHCNEPVVVTQNVTGGFKLHKITNVSKQESRERGRAIAAADGQIANAQDRVWEAERNLADGKRQVNASIDARTKLQLIKNQQEKTSVEQLESCREQVRLAESHLNAFRIKKEADHLHATVEANQQIVTVLASDGLRSWKLAKAVGVLNKEVLIPLSKKAGWPTVALTDDLMPSLGARLYPLLSESEQFRVRVTIQVALSQMDGSEAIIIDRADILDRVGRNGMMRMLMETGIPTLVCMTILDPEKDPPPDLAAHGKGITYWVKNGTATPFHRENLRVA